MKNGLAIVVLIALGTVAHADHADQAREKFKKGVAHFQAGEYDAAIADYNAALRLYPAADFLFNLAQAYRLKGDKARALAHYRKYLALDPDGRAAKEARIYTAVLELETKPEPAKVVEAPPPPPSSYMPGQGISAAPGQAGGYGFYNPVATAQRLSVCIETTDSWRYCDGFSRPISENEFIKRYHQLTGSPRLDPYIEQPPNRAGLIAVGAVSVAMIIGMAAGWSNLNTNTTFTDSGGFVHPERRGNDAGFGAGIFFTVGLAATTVIGWPLATRQPKTHHKIEQPKAQRFVDYYNATADGNREGKHEPLE